MRSIRFTVTDYNGVQLHQETLEGDTIFPDSPLAVALWEKLRRDYPPAYLFRETFDGVNHDAAKERFVKFGDFFQHSHGAFNGKAKKASDSNSAKRSSQKQKVEKPPKEKVKKAPKSIEPIVYF